MAHMLMNAEMLLSARYLTVIRFASGDFLTDMLNTNTSRQDLLTKEMSALYFEHHVFCRVPELTLCTLLQLPGGGVVCPIL